MCNVGLDSLVGIATRYRLDDPGIEYRFCTSVQTGPGAHTLPYTTGNGSFPGCKAVQNCR
jgi:altronate dehydratase